MPANQPRTIFIRWLFACVIDYALLIAAVLFFALGWPSGQGPLQAVILISLAYLLYQPLGEVLGGTLGQRLAGIRLVAPGTVSITSIATVIRRHGERIGIFWGILAAILYWRERLSASAPERFRIDWHWAERRR